MRTYVCVCMCVESNSRDFDSAHMHVLSEHIHRTQLSIVRYLSVRSLRSQSLLSSPAVFPCPSGLWNLQPRVGGRKFLASVVVRLGVVRQNARQHGNGIYMRDPKACYWTYLELLRRCMSLNWKCDMETKVKIINTHSLERCAVCLDQLKFSLALSHDLAFA